MLSHCKPAGGCRRTQPHKAQINLPRFQRAKLFRRSHVEEVQRDVGEGLPESRQRFGQQLEIKIGQIGDVQLAGFAAAETLHRQNAFGRQGQNAPGINQERAAFLGQGHLAFGTVQEAHTEFLLQIMDLARERGLG